MPEAFTTHDVVNQSPPYEDVNLFLTDQPLMSAVKREGSSLFGNNLKDFGDRKSVV